MDIKEMLRKYQQLGVFLWTEGEKLRFSSPIGIMNEALKNELKENKEAIIKTLKAIESKEVIPDCAHRYEPFLLNGIQSSFLVGLTDAYEYGGTDCHIYVELQMEKLDIGAMNHAWEQVIQRHDMLRAKILPNGYQKVIDKAKGVEIVVDDVRELTQQEFEACVLKNRAALENKIYDTETWPLFEIRITQGSLYSIMHCSLDMLIADSISVSILLKEVMHYYFKPDEALEPLEITYRDVCLYNENKKYETAYVQKRREDKAYWLEKVKTLPGPPSLPTISAMEEKKPMFTHRQLLLEKEQWHAMHHIASEYGLTMSSLILAIYAEVIGLWAKKQEYCLSVTIMKRPNIHKQIYDIIGDFTNVNILGVQTKRDKTFLQRALTIQENLWEDLEHTTYTGIDVLREIGREEGKNVVIPFVYTSTIGLDGYSDDLIQITYKKSRTPQVFIDCQVGQSGEQLEICWDVRESVFKPHVVDEMFEAFRSALNKVANDKETWQQKTVVTLPEATQGLRDRVNATKVEINKANIVEGFLTSVKKRGNQVALICDDTSYTYETLAQYAFAYTKLLLEKGLQKGEAVIISEKKGLAQISGILGILLAGGYYVPIDYNRPKVQKHAIAKELGARYGIVTETSLEDWKDSCLTEIIVGEVEKVSKKEQKISMETDTTKPAYIIYTSGSTGKPKGVVMSHGAVYNTLVDINEKFEITEEDKALGIANPAFDLSVYDIFGVFLAGGTLVLPDSDKMKDPEYLVSLLLEKGITVWNSVPAYMQLIMPYLMKNSEGLKLQKVLLSGDWIPISLVKDLNSLLPKATLVSLGGATEAAIWSIYHFITKADEEKVSVPYGVPLANQRFYILNSNKEQCPNGTVGDIYIAGEGLANGYFNDEELTKSKFMTNAILQERLYETGDLGRYLENGEIEFLGREDSQVKIRGHRIELGEIENVLKNCTAVDSAIVIADTLEEKEKQLHAFVVPAYESKLDYTEEKSQLEEKLTRCAEEYTAHVNGEKFKKYMSYASDFALVEIMDFFCEKGIFTQEGQINTYQEILTKIEARVEYHKLVKRWLTALSEEGFIQKVSESTSDISYKCCKVGTKAQINALRELLLSNEAEELESQISMNYFNASAENIHEVLVGNKEPQEILFPEGKTELAFGVYHNNIFSRCLNNLAGEAIVMAVDELLKEHPNHTVRIMEVGAGTGGTTDDILPHLKGKNIEYYFTDVSAFFLNKAREKYAKYPWMKYQVFDINEDFKMQGIKESSIDIILCANVLHMSVNGYDAMQVLKSIATAKGYLIIIDAVKELNSLLTSMGFLYRIDATDERGDNIFFELPHWYRNFERAQTEILFKYPAEDNFLACSYQRIFISRFNEEKVGLTDGDVFKYLKDNVQDYMMPVSIEILNQFPLTANGKVDTKALRKHLNVHKENNVLIEAPQGELEQQIEKIWREVLNVKRVINRNEAFFEIGGDSLLLAQVIGRIKEEVKEAQAMEWNTLMRILMQNSTIELFAKALESSQKETEKLDVFSVIAEGHEEPTIVLFSDGTGTLSIYNELVEQIKARVSNKIVGFSCKYDEIYLKCAEQELIEQLGVRCANHLKAFGNKKYIFIGHCFGGNIALETARNLKNIGIDNIELIMIDTKRWLTQISNEIALEKGFATILGADLHKAGYDVDNQIIDEIMKEHKAVKDKFIEQSEFLQRVKEKLGDEAMQYSIFEKDQTQRIASIYRAMPNASTHPTAFELKEFNQLYQIFKKSVRSFIDYKPQAYEGNATAFYCTENDDIFSLVPEKMYYTAELAVKGEITKVSVEGKHLTCMASPHVNTIVEVVVEKVKAAKGE